MNYHLSEYISSSKKLAGEKTTYSIYKSIYRTRQIQTNTIICKQSGNIEAM